MGIWCTGMIASRCIQKQNTSSLLSLCTAIITYIFLCGYLPFRADNTITFAQQNADPEIEFEIRYWKVSDQAKSFLSDVSPPSIHSIVPPPGRFYATLGLPHCHHRCCCFCVPHYPSTLRKNWSPRAKRHSALTGIRAPNRFTYFAAAAASQLSTQSSGGWSDLDPNPCAVNQVMMLVKVTPCLVLGNQADAVILLNFLECSGIFL